MKYYLRWTANFTTKPPIVTTTINLKSDLHADDLLEVCV